MNNELQTTTDNTHLMGVSTNDVKAISAHLSVIKEFVSSELRQGLDNDYGMIPGTKKKVLFKPGAEKLMRLFHLRSEIECVEKIVRPEENFAMFTYKASVIHIKTGTVVAQCEGVCNNHEDKYREKAVWNQGKKIGTESVNVMNILNTLMKMAQKRAIVGAVILATGASDYFTQDEEEITYQNTPKTVDNSKFVDVNAKPTGLAGYVIEVGKHKGKSFQELGVEELTKYLNWITSNVQNPTGKMLECLNAGREYLREAV